MRIQFFVAGLFVFCLPALAQKPNSENQQIISTTSFIAEAGGAGIAFSATIDKRFAQSHVGFGGRIGLGFVSADEPVYSPTYGYDYNTKSALTIPVQLNYIFGKNNSPHCLEVGAGVTYVTRKLEIMNFYDDLATQVFGTLAFMYRRQPVNGGFSWRVGFTPIFGKSYIQPFGAASVGYNF